MNWSLAFQIVTAVGGVSAVIALFSLPWVLKKTRSETRKNEADAAAVLSESALAFLAPARAEIGELEKRLKAANARCAQLEEALQRSQTEVQDLRNQVKQMATEMHDLRDENERLRGR